MLAERFHILPRDMGDLTTRDLIRINRYLEAEARAIRAAERRARRQRG